MAIANPRPEAIVVSSGSRATSPLFKEDRPRRIDQFISFFGDTDEAAHHDAAPEQGPAAWE